VAKYGTPEMAVALLDARMDPNIQNAKLGGVRPLNRAAWDGNLAMVRALVEHGADVNAGSFDGRTPLCDAALGNADDEQEALALVGFLLGAGANLNPSKKGGSIPLSCAKGGPIAKMLLDAGADVDAVDDTGTSALLSATMLDDVEKVRVLLKAGARTDFRTQDGFTALDIAVGNENRELQQMLSRAHAPRGVVATSASGCGSLLVGILACVILGVTLLS
jgi:ankyrin repeat protein